MSCHTNSILFFILLVFQICAMLPILQKYRSRSSTDKACPNAQSFHIHNFNIAPAKTNMNVAIHTTMTQEKNTEWGEKSFFFFVMQKNNKEPLAHHSSKCAAANTTTSGDVKTATARLLRMDQRCTHLFPQHKQCYYAFLIVFLSFMLPKCEPQN